MHNTGKKKKTYRLNIRLFKRVELIDLIIQIMNLNNN
jgi:hypothetical protein